MELATNKFLSDSPKDGQEILLLGDEFVRIGKMKVVVEAPALSREQKFIVLFIAQDYAQLEDLYGKTGVEKLKTTTSYKIIFTQNNENTAEAVSKWIGKETIERESVSKRSDWKSASKDKNITKEGLPLISAQNIGSLTDDQVIIIAQGHNTTPIMAKTCKWFKHPQMKNLIDS